MLSVNAKINRALEILKQINDEYAAWKTSNPIQTVTECNVERTQFILGVRFATEPQGLRWSLLAGELLFDLRCALDHLVYFVATNDSGQDPPPDAEKLMFPIATSEQRFQSAVSRGQLNGLKDLHKDIIKSHQPYVKSSPPEDSALFALHYLNSIDKHRHLHISVFSVVRAEADLKGLPPGVTNVSINEEPLQKADWVISFETSEPCRGPEGELKFSLRLGVFEERYRKHQLLDILKKCVDAVIDVARPFQPDPGVQPTPASGRA